MSMESQNIENSQEKITLETVKDYFENMPDFNEPELLDVKKNASGGNFLKTVRTKDGRDISAYGLMSEDLARTTLLKESAEKFGNLVDLEKYTEEERRLKEIVDFIKKNIIEKAKNRQSGGDLNEKDAENIINAMQSDFKKIQESPKTPSPFGTPLEKDRVIPTENARDKEPKEPIISPPPADTLKPIEISQAVAEDKKEKQKWLFPEAQERKEEKPESEFRKTRRQLMEFEKLWKSAQKLTKKKNEFLIEDVQKEKLANLSREIIVLAEELAKKQDKDGKWIKRDLIHETRQEAGLADDPKFYKNNEFKDLLTKKAYEIYKGKSLLYNKAKKIIQENKKNHQLKEIIDNAKKEIKEKGQYEKNGKVFKDGDKINGRLLLKDGQYFFELAGGEYEVLQNNKIEELLHIDEELVLDEPDNSVEVVNDGKVVPATGKPATEDLPNPREDSLLWDWYEKDHPLESTPPLPDANDIGLKNEYGFDIPILTPEEQKTFDQLYGDFSKNLEDDRLKAIENRARFLRDELDMPYDTGLKIAIRDYSNGKFEEDKPEIEQKSEGEKESQLVRPKTDKKYQYIKLEEAPSVETPDVPLPPLPNPLRLQADKSITPEKKKKWWEFWK